jgi:hypothetical protein
MFYQHFYLNLGREKIMKQQKTGIVTMEEREQILLNRTYTERFEMLMKLIRIGKMLKTAKIIESKK